MKKFPFLLLYFFLAWSQGWSAAKNTVIEIGVLAHKNYDATHTMWDATADYLNGKIPGYEFHITPLRFEEFPAYLRDKKINFVVINSAYYVDLEYHYGISRIATLKNADLNGEAQTEFGGVIFTGAESPLRSLEEVRGKRFAAVDEESFGGWIMGLRELKEKGIDAEELKVTFYGTHEAVVKAVSEGKADAGTVRSDTLERMAAEGKINLDDFRILGAKNYPHFYYLTSTRLYPEWPIATTKHTPDELAEKVAVALISMPKDSEAARDSKSVGWTIPLDYQSIHECLRELERGPYAYSREDALVYFLEKYWGYLVAGGVAFVLLGLITLYISRINGRLREARHKLEEVNLSLEEKIAEKTRHLYEKSAKLEEAFLNEKYLRSILRTVADVNQMLIATRSVEELVEESTLCLSSNESLKSAKICLVEGGNLRVAAVHGMGDEKIITGVERKVFEEGVALMITDFEHEVSEECREKAERYGIRGIYALPLRSNTFERDVIGVLSICTAHENGFSIEEQKMIEELAGDIGFAINAFTQRQQIDALHEERIRNYESFIEALVNMIEQRDTYTAGHTERVAHYARLIAQEMELSEKEIERLVMAAKLHDIGKVVTPDSILLKPGSLSKLEYELIKEHVNAGYEVLSTIHLYRELADIMLYHHERYDGSGYPTGKKGEEIPMLGHILAVADSFDAMTTNRIYKPRKEVAESLRELNELSGKWYHPAVVNAAVKVLSGVKIDTSISQMGSSAVEEERMSYFFKDRLTRLYNEDYFSMTLCGRSHHPKPRFVWILSLVDFNRYNKLHGWENGNRCIARFAAYLMEQLPDTLIFRIWGDRFVIADYDGEITALLANSCLSEEGVAVETKKIENLGETVLEVMSRVKEG